jgi:hypothetical protein
MRKKKLGESRKRKEGVTAKIKPRQLWRDGQIHGRTVKAIE